MADRETQMKTNPGMSRREFLAAAAVAAGTVPVSEVVAGPAHKKPSRPRVDVVQVTSDHVVRGRQVHHAVMPEMLDLSLRSFTGEATASDAWRSILRPSDVIGIKFNSSAAEALGVSEPFAKAVIRSLLEAGFARDQIIPIEAPGRLIGSLGVGSPVRGWQADPVDFGSGQDHLSAVLDQVTAIINVPFLKTHNIAGVTCSLKNLSHGLIKHPARYHGSHCSPYIGDIVALPQIRSKLRLNLVNALRTVFDGGPEARDDCTWDSGIILAGANPASVDSVGLELINSQRIILGLAAVDDSVNKSVHLAAAEKRGLGHVNTHRLEIARYRI